MSDAETTSEQDGAGTSAFVMPSLNMGGGTTTTARYATTENSSAPEVAAATSQRLLSGGRSEADRVRILVLGSTADDRRTFAKLVSLDDDDDDEDRSRHRVQSSASSEGVTDMSFSFLSTRPAPSNPRTEPRSANLPRPPNEDETFEALSPRAGSATLFQLADDERSTARLLDKLQMPFERLEAKISRTYPATDRLADLVSSASCGSFDACLFLFSSPPTAKEVALARPVSRLVPLFPVLLLPPPPSGKSQKTNALCHAVQEQLNGADVRWLPASSLGKNSRRRSGGGGGGPLFMLPHDLFAQQPPPVFDSHAGPCGDSPPFSAPLSSRDSPNSLASSQEVFALPPTPHSPALTAMSSAPPSSIGTGEERPGRHGARRESGGGGGVRSLLASGLPSTRAGSSVSRSDSRRRSQQRRRRGHRGGGGGHSSTQGGGGSSSSESDSTSDSRHMYGSSTSLADLKRLQFMLHDPSLSDTLRHLVARAFLEWREVEIAAMANGSSRDFPTAETRADLPSEWGETLLENERGAFQDTGVNARKGLDFSRRVAERRQALRALAAPPPQSRGVLGSERAQTQTQTEEEDEEAEGAPITASTTRESTTSSAYWTDPTTPRCIQRGLPSFVGGTAGATDLNRAGGDGYFPATSSASVPWLDSASEFASSSTEEEGQQPTTAPRPLSPSSLVYLSPADPFHLPSLIHLVGLNLRLAFDPAAALARSATSPTPADEETAAEGTKSTSVWSWWRTAATVGLVFAAGVAIGAHVISRRAILFGPAPTLATAAVIASPADWASWSPAVLIRS
ncbi:hypothetical protein B0A53_02175 [Rhodotorula sp. CCFEE 5036]|nr:hypothetical protein B0A53_02175 [Rhodotorula sp. CCFEE 5036]